MATDADGDPGSSLKAGVLFSGATLALIAIAFWLLRFAFPTEPDIRAMQASALVALVVQVATFALARRMAARNLLVGWGIGAMLRLGTLVVYAVAVAPALGLPRTAALVSFATFLFLSMLVEPLLLGYAG